MNAKEIWDRRSEEELPPLRPDPNAPVAAVPARWVEARQITGHQINALNRKILIAAGDKLSAGGAPQEYTILFDRAPSCGPNHYLLRFHEGNPAEVGVQGLTSEALIAILIDRFERFQAGRFPCLQNHLALSHMEAAMHLLENRTHERTERGVEGQATP